LNSTFEDSNKYISSFIGFNNDNIELLANYFFQIGLSNKSNNSKKYLEKALQLFELCNLQDKTYSFERESNIKIIKNHL
jgi:acid phosphatase class B